MTTQARKDSWLAYYKRHRDAINAKRREKAKTASGDRHRAAALGYYYANRQQQNRKRTQRFIADRSRPQGAWAREIQAITESPRSQP